MDKKIILTITLVAIIAIVFMMMQNTSDTEKKKAPATPKNSCGDDICSSGEECDSCPSDCGDCIKEDSPKDEITSEVIEPPAQEDLKYVFDSGTKWKQNIEFFEGYSVNGLFTVEDFNGDGKEDVFFYDSNAGIVETSSDIEPKWMVFTSNGDSFADGNLWYRKLLADSGVFGDFNGDGKEDVINYNGYIGLGHDWLVSLSTGDKFEDGLIWTNSPWVNLYLGFLLRGDFNGDGKDDLLRYNTAGENALQWQVALSTGQTFEDWKTWSSEELVLGNVYYNYVGVSDFNGDGADDFLYYSTRPGETQYDLQVALSDGSSFGKLVTWMDNQPLREPGFSEDRLDLDICDFNGDGKDDLFYMSKMWGDEKKDDWQISLSNGDSFEPFETWLSADSIDISFEDNAFKTGKNRLTCGDVDGDDIAEIVVLKNIETESKYDEIYDLVVFDVV